MAAAAADFSAAFSAAAAAYPSAVKA